MAELSCDVIKIWATNKQCSTDTWWNKVYVDSFYEQKRNGEV